MTNKPLPFVLKDEKFDEKIDFITSRVQDAASLEWDLCTLTTLAFDAGVREGRRFELAEIQKILANRKTP